MCIFIRMEHNAHYPLLLAALAGAVEASSEILAIYKHGFSPSYKSDGSPVTAADLASNTILEKHLEATQLPIMTEETTHAAFEERRQWERYWCVDPLDGTKEFIKRNDEFAVNIALIENRRPVLGIIASPVERTILIGGELIPPALVSFDAVGKTDSWLYIEPKQTPNSPLVIASSRTPHTGTSLAFINELKEQYGEPMFIKKGSALKFFDIALGTADIYPRFAPTMEWDIAAGQAIVEALGGSVTHPVTGESLYYNKESLVNPHFVVTGPALLQSRANG